jgi:hypothetical protein
LYILGKLPDTAQHELNAGHLPDPFGDSLGKGLNVSVGGVKHYEDLHGMVLLSNGLKWLFLIDPALLGCYGAEQKQLQILRLRYASLRMTALRLCNSLEPDQ